MSFDDIFKEMKEFQKKMNEEFFKDFNSFGGMKSIDDFDAIEEKLKEGGLPGKWEFKPIEKPGMNGFIIRGYISTPNPNNNPEEILPPLKPKVKEPREPLYDISIGKEHLTVYIELPGITEENIKLDVKDRKLNLEAGNFKADIDLSAWMLDTSKMLQEYNNGILKLIIPRTELKEQSF